MKLVHTIQELRAELDIQRKAGKKIGFVPTTNAEYVLTYDNNGTTKENKPCDCDPELDCECEVYDDVLLSVERR